MDIIKELVGKLTDTDKHGIYLREIALLMEEIDSLKGQLRVKENLIKNFEKEIEKNANSKK